MISAQYYSILSKRLREKSPLVQILLGPRQVGKTTVAQRIFNEWEGSKLYATADSPTPPSADWIRLQWENAMKQGIGALLILDEVQKIEGWSEMVKLLFDKERGKGTIKILLLGSSSLALQRGMGESLAGRFELLRAPHWSYHECREAFGWDFQTFLRFGAYPGAASFASDERRWKSYILESIVEPVLGRDILGQRPVSKPALFRQTFELAVHYPAQILSLNKMLGQLQERGNAATIKNYLELMEQAFLLLLLEKYSGSPVRIKSSSPKIVILNHALIHAYTPQKRLDEDPGWYGFVFESVLGAHLSLIPDVELFYWREGNDEVDYVLKTPEGLHAIEIKSGPRKKGKGINAFFQKYPHARCEIWNYDRCLEFLDSGKL